MGDIIQYVRLMISELEGLKACMDRGADVIVHNMVVSRGGRGANFHEFDNRHGPVWTGIAVPKEAMLLDSEQDLLNEDGYRYAVLHQYDVNEALWKLIGSKF